MLTESALVANRTTWFSQPCKTTRPMLNEAQWGVWVLGPTDSSSEAEVAARLLPNHRLSQALFTGHSWS